MLSQWLKLSRPNIIRRDGYTQVSCHFNGSNVEDLKEALLFYLGFTSGRLIQPYIIVQQNGHTIETIISSVDDTLVYQEIPPPVSDIVYGVNKNSLDNYHFDLFRNILNARMSDKNLFESTFSQWSRIWHSFHSYEIGVLMLTLSVAVEGILNDIFIPKLTDILKDDEFEAKKEKIICSIRSIADIDGDHLNSISKYISKWGNVHSKRAIEFLIKKEIVTSQQRKCWIDLRNSSAHPKLVKISEGRRKKDYNQIIICLGMFYCLVLNSYSYKGPLYAYEKVKDNRLVMCFGDGSLFGSS